MKNTPLTERELNFCVDYVKFGKLGETYRRYFDCTHLKEGTIASRASKFIRREKIATQLEALRVESATAAKFGVADVLKELVDIVTADPGELMAHRRLCCRHCYGKNNRFQWINKDEFLQECAIIIDTNARVKKDKQRELPRDDGGYGFNRTLAPSPDCPKCQGEGHGGAWFADTRFLSDKGRKLFAGIKETKDGFQILTRNQDAALQLLARSLGMLGTDGQGPGSGAGAGGAPLPPLGVNINLPVDPQEASRIYAMLVKQSR